MKPWVKAPPQASRPVGCLLYTSAMRKLRMGIGFGLKRFADCLRSALPIVVVTACIVHISAAQGPAAPVPDVVQASVPFYPADALAARISGEVHLHLATDGRAVIATSDESGPAMLVKGAEENVRTWRFADHAATSFDVAFKYKLTDSAKCETGSGSLVLHLPREVEVEGMTSRCDMARFAKQQKFLLEQHVYPVELAITLNGKPIGLPREVSISNGIDSVMLPTIDGIFLAPQAMRGGAPLTFRTVVGKELIEEMCIRDRPIVVVIACIAHIGAAQGPAGPGPDVVQASVPFYPPDALAARISGEVHLHLSTDGKAVVATSDESGPAMLVKGAEENVRTWRFADHAATSFDVAFKYLSLIHI